MSFLWEARGSGVRVGVCVALVKLARSGGWGADVLGLWEAEGVGEWVAQLTAERPFGGKIEAVSEIMRVWEGREPDRAADNEAVWAGGVKLEAASIGLR
jgi:hypothetical protein